MKKVLIISDAKQGHFNQSIAFCKIKGVSWDVVEVSFKSKFHKLLSYLYARMNYYTDSLFKSYFLASTANNISIENLDDYCAIIATGSSTYYLAIYLGKKYSIKTIALMYPKGYKVNHFDYIIAQKHDNYPLADNIIQIPLNLSYISRQHHLTKTSNEPALCLVVGGDNDVFDMDEQIIRHTINTIFEKYPTHQKYITTSRRTPKSIETLIDGYSFDYKLIYSKNPQINPIGDFIEYCELFFITIDSTSMISEVRANSDGQLVIIDLPTKKQTSEQEINKHSKYHRLVDIVNNIDNKIDFNAYLQRITL